MNYSSVLFQHLMGGTEEITDYLIQDSWLPIRISNLAGAIFLNTYFLNV